MNVPAGGPGQAASSANLPGDWLVAGWHVEGVGALITTRQGGCSESPYDTMNLGSAVGDAPERVAANRALLADRCRAAPVFLEQIHGSRVVRLLDGHARPGAPVERADASVTTEPGIACTVLVADCLPVLFAAPAGRGVAAAHAGWRGLAGGVLEATLDALCDAAACAPDEVGAWLGPCIGPDAFEVGADVLQAFDRDPAAAVTPRFTPQRPDKWLADLAGLARDRLQAAGVRQIGGGGHCTVSEPSRFFSYRRDRFTGRMAAAVWIVGRGAVAVGRDRDA